MKKQIKQLSLIAGLMVYSVSALANEGPDLLVQNVELAAQRAQAGKTVAVKADISNLGGGIAAASRMKYYLSSDETFDAGDKYLNYDRVSSLAVNGTSRETANLRMPKTIADGTYYILFVADINQEVTEVNEDNNVTAVQITVGAEEPAASITEGPDLILSELTLSRHAAESGERVKVTLKVKNAGNQAAGASRLKYYISKDERFDSADKYLRNYEKVIALNVDAEGSENANLRIPAGFVDGECYLLIVLDPNNEIVEIDESNNVVAKPFYVGVPPKGSGKPDLVLTKVHLPTLSVRPGETLAITSSVLNQGTGDAGASNLEYFLSRDQVRDEYDKNVSFDKVNALGANGVSHESAELRIKPSTDGGEWYLLTIVDAKSEVDESDETNNQVATKITVVQDDPNALKPDLVLLDVKADALSAEAGNKIKVSCTVSNIGPEPAGASRVKYFLSTDANYSGDDKYLNYDNVGSLSPQGSSAESASVRIPTNFADGQYYVVIVADQTEAVDERIESNNVVALPITVGRVVEKVEPGTIDDNVLRPDLIVTNVVLDRVVVRPGKRFRVDLEVKNIGAIEAPQTRVKYFLSRDQFYQAGDKYIGYDRVGALDISAQSPEYATPKVPAKLLTGRWYLLMVADATNAAVESDETNNLAVMVLTVINDDPDADKADLAFDSVELDHSHVAQNARVEISYALRNKGTQNASSSRLKVYLSDDDRYDAQDLYLSYALVPQLATEATTSNRTTVRIPVGTNDGDYYLLVVADINSEVSERFESNNQQALAIRVDQDGARTDYFEYQCPDIMTVDQSVYEWDTVATFNGLHLGWDNNKDMTAFACVVSHFEMIGLVEVDNEGGLQDLESALERVTQTSWTYHISEYPVGNDNGREYYGYIWRDDTVKLVEAVGYYPDTTDAIKREPYGVTFRMHNFDFTLVLLHLQYGRSIRTRRNEAKELLNVYHYFQQANGTENDVLIGGDMNLPGDDSAFTLVGVDGIRYSTDPDQKTSISGNGLVSSFDNIFYSQFTTETLSFGAMDFTKGNHALTRSSISDHIPVWIGFDTTVDDD